MSISSKLASAIKGSVREVAESVIDTNSIRILGQEIHEFESDITDSKQKLALIISQAIQLERQLSQVRSQMAEKEVEVASLLKSNDEAAAIVIAQEISELESKEKQLSKHQINLRSHEQTLKISLKEMVTNLEVYKNEYKMAKANDNMQKAQSKLSQIESTGENRLLNIENSLERIQNRQQEATDNMDAMAEVESSLGTSTSNAYKQTGSSAQDIMRRIKEKSL